MDRESQIPEQSPQAPEFLNPQILRIVNYAKRHERSLLAYSNGHENRESRWRNRNERTDFEDLTGFFDVLKSLDQNLEVNPKAPSLAITISPFACVAANEKIGVSDALTHEVIKDIKSHDNLYEYWRKSLKAYADQTSSLASRAGEYPFSYVLDQETTTNGGEELQEALAAIYLHELDVEATVGMMDMGDQYETRTPQEREHRVKEDRQLLQLAEKGLLAWQKQPHLAAARAPLRAKRLLYSHPPSWVIDDEGESHHRKLDKVRLLRPSQDGKSGYFIDLDVDDILLHDKKALGNLLLPSDEGQFDKEDKQRLWTHFSDGDLLRKWGDIPPAFCISVGANEHEYREIQKAGTNGNHLAYIDISFNRAVVEFSHVGENGASSKQGILAASKIGQSGRQENAPLAPDRLPHTEIRPGYHETRLPATGDLAILQKEIVHMRRHKKAATRLRDNKTYLQLLQSFGLENVRIRFDDIQPRQTRELKQLLDKLNEKYTAPRVEALGRFYDSHQDQSLTMQEGDRDAFINFFAPPLKLEDLFAIETSKIVGPVAENGLPHNLRNELFHNSIPEMEVTPDGVLTCDSREWMDMFRLDYILGTLGTNIYNTYANLTDSWRKFDHFGAEDLGGKTSPDLAAFMQVKEHHSTTGTPVRKIDGQLVEIDFETAKPSPNEEDACAFAMLYTEKDGAFLVRPRYRDTLYPYIVEAIQIDDSKEYNDALDEVTRDLTRNCPPNQIPLIKEHIRLLQNQWIELSAEISPLPPGDHGERPPRNALVLTQLAARYEPFLRAKNKEDSTQKAFQIVLAAGMRLRRREMLSEILTMQP